MQEMWVWSLGWKIPWRRKRQPTPVFLPGESHGQRSLVDYSPWGRKELAMTERARTHTHTGHEAGALAGEISSSSETTESSHPPPPHTDSQRTPPKNQQEGAQQTPDMLGLWTSRTVRNKCLFITLHTHLASQSKSATLAGMDEDTWSADRSILSIAHGQAWGLLSKPVHNHWNIGHFLALIEPKISVLESAFPVTLIWALGQTGRKSPGGK